MILNVYFSRLNGWRFETDLVKVMRSVELQIQVCFIRSNVGKIKKKQLERLN